VLGQGGTHKRFLHLPAGENVFISPDLGTSEFELQVRCFAIDLQNPHFGARVGGGFIDPLPQSRDLILVLLQSELGF